jgi:hypothetical protein
MSVQSLVFLILAGLGTKGVLYEFLHTVGPDLWGFIEWREVECDFLAELQKHSTHTKNYTSRTSPPSIQPPPPTCRPSASAAVRIHLGGRARMRRLREGRRGK